MPYNRNRNALNPPLGGIRNRTRPMQRQRSRPMGPRSVNQNPLGPGRRDFRTNQNRQPNVNNRQANIGSSLPLQLGLNNPLRKRGSGGSRNMRRPGIGNVLRPGDNGMSPEMGNRNRPRRRKERTPWKRSNPRR